MVDFYGRIEVDDFIVETNKLKYRSFVDMEMNHFQRSVVFQHGHLHNPATVKLQQLLVVDFAQPEINLREVLLHLYADTV